LVTAIWVVVEVTAVEVEEATVAIVRQLEPETLMMVLLVP
jgi:hypothetical protein